MKFGDSEIKMAVREFLAEAQACAQHRKEDGVNILGFSAMLTAFSCILAVGEMLVIHRNPEKCHKTSGKPKRPLDKECIREFYNEMREVIDEQTWLVLPEGDFGKDSESSVRDEPWKLLSDLRNALVHAVSMTRFVALVPTREAAQSNSFRRRSCIVVPDFVAAVSKTFERVVEENPDVHWDPAAPTMRGLAAIVPAPSGGSLIGETTPIPVGLEGETDLMEYPPRRSGYGTV